MKKGIAVSLILVFLSVCTFPVIADQLSDAKNKKGSIDKQLSDINRKKAQAQKALEEAEVQKENLLNAQAAKDKEYEKLSKDFSIVTAELKEIEKTIKETETEFNRQRDLYAKRLKAIYETSGISVLETLLDSKSILDFFERLEFLSRISEKDTKLMEELDAAKKDQEVKLMEMDLVRKELSRKSQSLKENIQFLKSSRAEKETEIQKINMTLEQYEKKEDELIRISAELARSIQSLMSKNTKYASGAMVWPSSASKAITSYYGMRYHPILKKTKLHTGVDIGAGFGSSILAAQKGTVVLAGWQNGYGNTVIIDHGGGIATLYAHASKLLVSTGTQVNPGSVIALVGSTGWSTGPHLHFEVIVNGKTVNPLDYIK